MFTFVNLRALGVLLLVAGLVFGVWGLRSQPPDAGELQSHTLAVDAVDMLVVEKKNGDQRLGPVLFLGEPKPQTLPSFLWERSDSTRDRLVAIPFLPELDLSDAEIKAMDTYTPARMRIETWNGLAVGVSIDDETLLSVATTRERLAQKQQLRFTIAAACLLAALIALVGAWRLRPRTETLSFHQPGEPQ